MNEKLNYNTSSMNKNKKILITNDDGINAPGIRHLWEQVRAIGDVTVVAPSKERSGASLSITIRDHLDLREQEAWPQAWHVNGTPADCVKMARNLLFDTPPDLVLSGINRGSNAGRNVLYSGTVAGVIEAVLNGIPGVAFSCQCLENPNYERALAHIPQIVEYILKHPPQAGTLLNVTFPCYAPEVKGVRLAKQGLGYWKEVLEPHIDPSGRTLYRLGCEHAHFDEDPDSDIALLADGYVTVVPIQVSSLTDETEWINRQKHFLG